MPTLKSSLSLEINSGEKICKQLVPFRLRSRRGRNFFRLRNKNTVKLVSVYLFIFKD